MADQHRFLVAAAMRNEGPFILEWVCWYRMLGFDRILVATNDCTDRSPQLLNALHDAGWLTHITHSPYSDRPPKDTAHRAIRSHPLTAATEWLLICDVDELLVLHQADSIGGYVAGFDPLPIGFAFHWKAFGTGGETDWHDRLYHRDRHDSAPERSWPNVCFKSLYRRPLDFAHLDAHAPRTFTGDPPPDAPFWVDCRGAPLKYFRPDQSLISTKPEEVRHDLAQMNHYVLRCRESFELKRGTPSASKLVDRYSQNFFDRFDRAGDRDESALRFADAFDRVHAEALALPGVARLHHLCCADYVARLARNAGRDPVDDPRHRCHLDLAAAASGA